jgi:4-hydroxy-4-methyl-2-oxoglutarate aldolase
VTVGPGDIVVGDEDGVAIVPFDRIAATIVRLVAVRAAEADMDAKVKAGLQMPAWIDSLIAAGRFHEVD